MNNTALPISPSTICYRNENYELVKYITHYTDILHLKSLKVNYVPIITLLIILLTFFK
jgi:hypothetical protein